MNAAAEVARAVNDADTVGVGWIRISARSETGRYDLERVDPVLVVESFPVNQDIRDQA